MKKDMARRYGVVGSPVRHSLSPWLHAYFARTTQRNIVYAAYAPSPDKFVDFVNDFFASGGCGLNITVPFKPEALAVASRASAFARRAGAANVLRRDENSIVAHNTDGAGLIKDLTQNLNVSLAKKRVLIVGAGGAARAAALALADSDARITIGARRPEAAAELAQLAEGESVALAKCESGFEVIINATSGAHDGDGSPLSPEVFEGSLLAYDMNYGQAAAGFLRSARAAKQRADGGGMLAEQAAMSFAVWEKVMPSATVPIDIMHRRHGSFWQ